MEIIEKAASKLNERRIKYGTAAAGGLLVLAACGSTTHGVAGMKLIDCHSGPKANTLTLADFSKGQSFSLGKDIDYDGTGMAPPITITSLGDGGFKVNFHVGSDNKSSSASSIGTPEQPLTVADHDQAYRLSSQVDSTHTESLTITASCLNG